jgi:hypothetical protein
VGTRLSPTEMELYRRTDEVLHYLWDPCSVSACADARDEYHAYLPVVFDLLKRGASASELAEYLGKVEEERMGVGGDATARVLRVAEVLVAWREQIAG